MVFLSISVHAMWRNKLLLLVSAALGSLVFSQETNLKADFASELSAGTVLRGRLVVGKGVKLVSGEAANNGSEVQDGLSDDSEGYQSDQQESTAESRLQHLNPFVHCGEDAMALRVRGSRVPHFMVDRGDDGLVPVSRMPANCGFSVKRARRDVFLVVHYQGCNVTQEGENYVLPLHLWGAHMSMSCPVAPSPDASKAVPAEKVPDSDPKYPSPGYLPYHHRHPFYPYDYSWAFPTSTPTDTPTTTVGTTTSTAPTVPASDPRQPRYPYPGFLPYHHRHPFYPYGYTWALPTGIPTATPTTTATSTTTAGTSTAPASDPQQPGYLFPGFLPYRHRHPFYRYGYPWAFPTSTPTVTPTTTTTSTTPTSTAPPAPASDPQQLGYLFPDYFRPYHHRRPSYKYGYPWVFPASDPTVAPTTTATTTTTTTAATSTAPAAPASDPQQLGYLFPDFRPYHHGRPSYKYGYPWVFPASDPTAAPTVAPTTTTTATSTAPAAPASDPQQPGYLFPDFRPYHHRRPSYKYGFPWVFPASAPTVTPTVAPTTATSTVPPVPASDPQQPGYPFAHVYPFGHVPYYSRQIYQYGYPWVHPANAYPVAPTSPTSSGSDAQKPIYPPFPMHNQEYQKPITYYNHHSSAQDASAPWPCNMPFLTDC